MRQTMLGLSLGLALAATAPAAQAADLGGLKDRGVLVPAPIPVVETFKWYLRADAGGGLYTGGDPSTRGDVYGLDREPTDGTSFGVSSAWFNNGFDTFALGGVGVGAYLGPRFRADVTVDARMKNNLDADGSYNYQRDLTLSGGNIQRVYGLAHERTEVRDTVALLNFYWDFAERGSRFVPYIGAGVGFAVRTIDRWHATQETIVDETNPLAPTTVLTRGLSGEGKAHQVSLAAAAQAGFAYTLNQGMVLDFSYRLAYLGAVDAAMPINNNSSRLTVGDTFEHALRAGVRWNVW
mgnify:CR=1 FL=1